jgi:signal transduction histidine kinase
MVDLAQYESSLDEPPSGGPLAADKPPERDFVALTRTFVVLLLAAMLLPGTFLALYALSSWEATERSTQEILTRSTRIAEEHALRVFELNDDLNDRVLQFLGNASDEDIRDQSRVVHENLVRIISAFPQITGIMIFGVDGDLLSTSRAYPAPAVNIGRRDDFVRLRQERGEQISRVVEGRLSGQKMFITGIARQTPEGNFAGVVSVAMSPGYFSNFYEELHTSGNDITLSLYRMDGHLLASYPPVDADAYDLVSNDAVSTRRAFLRAPSESLFVREALAGAERFAAYRRIGSRPVYISATLPVAEVKNDWLVRFGVVAGATLLPTLLLCSLIVLALRRLSSEERAWRNWSEQSTARRTAEELHRQSLKMESLGRISGGVAHDFNNLLMIVAANARLIRMRNPSGFDKQWLAIERAIRTGESLTRRLLTVSRKQLTHAEIVSLQKILPEWRELLESSVEPGCAVQILVSPDTEPVNVDITDLQLALINLITNARDALPGKGKIVISARNEASTRDKSDRNARRWVRLSVSDNGAGMTEEVAAHAFEPFFTTKDVGKGTGLGLPQVYAFCRQSGGNVRLQSHPNVGTTVSLLLPPAAQIGLPPLPPEVSKPMVTSDEQDAEMASGETFLLEEDMASLLSPAGEAPMTLQPLLAAVALRILLVEDNAEVAEATAELLRLDAHDVQIASNAASGLRAIESDATFDVVVSDITMPGGMSGIDLALTLRATRPELPVILVTGHTEHLGRARQAGLLVLFKPVDLDALRAALPQKSLRISGTSS